MVIRMWDQNQHDLQNTARTDAVNRGNGGQLWRITDLICYSYSAPAVDINGIIYIYGVENTDCMYGTLYAINPDGTIKWQFQSVDLNGDPYELYGWNYEIVPSIGPDGTIYYTDNYDNDPDTNFVYAINPDGTLKWMYSASDIVTGQYHVIGSTIKIYDNTAYVLDNNYVYAIDAQTGVLKWSCAELDEYDFHDGFAIYDGFIYAKSGGKIYPGSNGTLYKIDVNSGNIIWSIGLVDSFYSGISVNNGGIFIIGYNDGYSRSSYAFAKFDINDGHNIWTNYIPIPDFGTGSVNYAQANNFVALDSTSVYYSTNSCYNCYGPGGPGYNFVDGRVFKYDFDGNLTWTSDVGLSSISPAIDGDGYIYTGDAKKIVKLNPSDGSVIWTYPITADYIPSSLAIGNDGTIYFMFSHDNYSGVHIDAIVSETVELPTFGDGSDGDVIISEDSILTKNTNFRNLTINEGVKLNTAGYRIRVQEKLIINGIIHNNGRGGPGGYGPNQSSQCDCVNCAAGNGVGGLGYGGSGGSGHSAGSSLGGAGSGGDVTILTPPSLSDLVNFGFPYLGGGGGGGGSSNQSRCYLAVTAYGAGGTGGSGGGIVIIQSDEISYGPNGYVQANGIDGGPGIRRLSHSGEWFFYCCPNFIPEANKTCNNAGFDCSPYAGYACPDVGGSACDQIGSGGGGGGGGAQFIISSIGYDQSRHETNPGNGGISVLGHNGSGYPGQPGNIYHYQIGAIPLLATISAIPDRIYSNSTSQITIYITDDGGLPVEGANIDVSTMNGSLDPINGVTDINGYFRSTYTAPVVVTTETAEITGIASKSGYTNISGTTTITLDPIVCTSITDVVANPTIVTIGDTISLTATVQPSTSIFTVVFKEGVNELGSTDTVSGIATYNWNTAEILAGTYNIKAYVSTQCESLTSTTVTLNAPPAVCTSVSTPTATLTTVTVGTDITLRAVAQPTTASFTVDFKDEYDNIIGSGSSTIGTGAATYLWNTADSLPGTYIIKAYIGSTCTSSGTISVTINSATTVCTSVDVVEALPSTVELDGTLALKATVYPTSTTFTVDFKDDGGNVIGTSNTYSGIATYNWNTLDLLAGTYLVKAYVGDICESPSYTTVTITLGAILCTSITDIIANPATVTIGDTTILTTTVFPTDSVFTVEFRDQYNNILGYADTIDGIATYNWNTLDLLAGTYLVKAYVGDICESTQTAIIIVGTATCMTKRDEGIYSKDRYCYTGEGIFTKRIDVSPT